jgi:hypothetical protein
MTGSFGSQIYLAATFDAVQILEGLSPYIDWIANLLHCGENDFFRNN